MTSTGIFIKPEAFQKIIFHSAKYPYNSVLGILAGDKPNDEASSEVIISHAFPVSHNWTSLSPMLEIAIEQIRLHLKRLPGNNAILGFYHGEERLLPYSDITSSKSPLKLPIAVALEEIIRLDLPSSFKAIAINVNPNLLALSGENEVKNPLEWQDHPLATKAKNGNSKVAIPTDYSIIASTIQALSTLQIPTDLHDFDEHLQNPSAIWLYS